jgi:hypothetical protein
MKFRKINVNAPYKYGELLNLTSKEMQIRKKEMPFLPTTVIKKPQIT